MMSSVPHSVILTSRLSGRVRRCITACAAALVVLFLVAPELPAQHLPIEYIMRIPKYYRLKGGSSFFSFDKTRSALLFDGGPYDTYVTYDEGASWETIFDMKMFFIDVNSTWRMDEVGNWYYEGNVYGKLIINLATEDAGKTIRYLIVDSSDVYNAWQDEAVLHVAGPRGVYMDVFRGVDQSRLGIYSSCDVGRTWKFSPRSGTSVVGGLAAVGRELINIPLDNALWLEYNICGGDRDTTALSTYKQYRRLSDGTLLQYPEFGSEPLTITSAGTGSAVTHTTYPDPEGGVARKLAVTSVSVLNDTMAVILAKGGVIATYGVNNGMHFVDVPPYRSAYQVVCDWGSYGDRILLRTLVPLASSDSIARYTIINTRTGQHKTFARPSTVFTNSSYVTMDGYQRLVPYSDSVWIASPEPGELMRTTDAGATWTMIDNIDRDPRWGLTYVGVNRLYPRGDGTMSVLTERSRLMVQDTATHVWSIAHLGPFAHSIKMSDRSYDQFTNAHLRLGEDLNGRYRCRYGPSTVYFHTPDTLWTSGDVVTRWTSSGEFIDTTLRRKARVIKRVSNELVVAAMDSVWFTWSGGKAWTFVSKDWPSLIQGTDTTRSALGDIVEADNKDLIVGLRGIRMMDTLNTTVDSIPGGILRSADSGNTWSRSTTGIPENLYVSSLIKLETGTLLCLALEVTLDPRVINDFFRGRVPLLECYREQFHLGQGFIYRSADNGRTWTQVHTFSQREFLPDVDPRIILMPDGRPMAIHPEVGIAISPNDGLWFSVGDPLYVGNPNINDVIFTKDGYAHCATDSGYLRIPIDRIMHVQEERLTVGSLSTYVNASGLLRISTADFLPQTLRVLSLDGRTAKHVTNVNGITELDVSTLVNGTYVVTASSSTEMRSGLIQIY